MGEWQGELVELDIINVAHGGITVARHEGRVVFVADAIPGERVVARITDDAKSSFWRADTIEVLKASEHRVPHVWSAASIERAPEHRAGGAEFGHIALAHQRRLKADVLEDALQRMAHVQRTATVEPVGDDSETGGLRWRTRVTLHVDAAGRVGPYAARSHTVIPVDDLPLATAAVEAHAWLDARVSDAASLEVLETSDGDVRVRRLARREPRDAREPRPRRDRGAREQRSPRAPEPAAIVERVGGRPFRVAENGFWQVHHEAAPTLTGAVQDLTREDLFDPTAANHDLYGGVGLLAAALGERFGGRMRITSVESDAVATGFAGENLAEWVGARAVTARVDRYLADLERQASAADRERLRAATMVIDPPRSGAGKEVVGSLTRLGVAQVVYVACDPVAFARDVGLFREGGYELGAMRAFDLFPHTHHVETVGVLARADDTPGS
jgi:tRNA/tmRNA/rRNA uracil-C5-methylase (TrmA/RlmC/RlmD family)